MTCLPRSGGCERPFTEAFVSYLNETEGARYVHRACLDVTDRKTPQPEAFYIDSEGERKLVVERKSVSWPIDYVRKHQNDHFVSERLTEELKGIALNGLYELSLPMLIEGKQRDLGTLAAKISQEIRSNWPEAASGAILQKRIDNNFEWSFRKVPEPEREDGEPDTGLKFVFQTPASMWSDYIDPAALPQELLASLEKIYASCVRKFARYSEARRALVLDPHGDLRHLRVAWWQDVFANHRPPAEITEIWSGIFDSVDENAESWVFERLR